MLKTCSLQLSNQCIFFHFVEPIIEWQSIKWGHAQPLFFFYSLKGSMRAAKILFLISFHLSLCSGEKFSVGVLRLIVCLYGAFDSQYCFHACAAVSWLSSSTEQVGDVLGFFVFSNATKK